MRSKGLMIPSIVVWSIFGAFFIIAMSIYPTINVNEELSKLFNSSKTNTDIFLTDHLLENLKNNINNPIKLAYFTFGYEGLSSQASIHSFGLFLFTISWNFIMPIFGIIGFAFALLWIFKLIVESFKREFKYKSMKTIGKWMMYVSMISLSTVLLIGLILISVLESQFSDSLKSDLWTGSSVADNYHDGFSIVTALTYLTNGTLFSILKGRVNPDIFANSVASFNTTLLQTSIVFLLVLTPMFTLLLVLGLTMWFSTFISHRNGGFSKFNGWVSNYRIDSRREYRSMLANNVWFIISSILFSLILVFPGAVHSYHNSVQVVITVISAIVVILSFTPLVIGQFMVNKMRQFSYNKLMWIQILLFWFVGTVLLLVIFVLLKENFNLPLWVSTFWPLLNIIGLTTCAFGFLKFRT